jgi:hypothetical protein
LALRAAIGNHNVAAWCESNRKMFENALYNKPRCGSLPAWRGQAGIYMVAFGGPSRQCAKEAIAGLKQTMPQLPIALCSDTPLGAGEDVFVQQDDTDIGGRRAKLRIWELAPAAWQYVLYIDADTECKAPITHYLDLLQMGWEFVICKDVHKRDLMFDYLRPNNKLEYEQTIKILGTGEALQFNGGVWAFRRCDRTKTFFANWLREWDLYAGRDQGALARALYSIPLRMFVLGNEWNFFPHYNNGETPVGLYHYPGKARRWEGQVPDGKRLSDPEAWAMVERFEQKQKDVAK